jgi:Domain of unknown function (DUF1772)
MSADGTCPAAERTPAVYIAFQIMTVMLAAVTMALSLAHALELPGKLRLNKEQYLAVQAIYYPGFTLGGIAEFVSIIAAVILLILTPRNSLQFWLISAALAALVAVRVIFWTMTQPVNKYWLQNTELSRVATHFFETGSAAATGDWTVMRDRWERSHVLRAIASVIAVLLLTTAVAL